MQAFIVFLLWTTFSILLQSEIFSRVSTFLSVDLIFPLVIVSAVRYSFVHGFLISMVLGALLQVLSNASPMFFIFSYVALFSFAAFLKAHLFFDSRGSLLAWFCVFSIFRQGIGIASSAIFGDVFRYATLVRVLSQVSLDVLVGVIVFYLFGWLLDFDWRRRFIRRGIRS